MFAWPAGELEVHWMIEQSTKPPQVCVFYFCLLWTFFGEKKNKKKKAGRKRKGSDELKIHYCASHQITFWPIFAPVSADVTEWPTQSKWDPAMHSTQQKHPQEEIFFWAFNIDALKNRRHILKDHFYGQNFSRSFVSMYGTYTLKKSCRFNFGD